MSLSSKHIGVLDVYLSDRPEPLKVGRLAESNREIFFEYDSGFTALGIEISPFALPAGPGLRREKDRVFAGLFGVFDDSLPDGWGRRLMDREFAQRGREPGTLSPLDRLHFIGERAIGALTYSPADDGNDEYIIDLDDLASQSERIYYGSTETVLHELVIAGGSPAGARPKILVAYNPKSEEMLVGAEKPPDGFVNYLVKFPTDDDGQDAGVIEMAYSEIAVSAGIEIPNTRLFKTQKGRICFGIERFDRVKDNARRHIHTLGGLLNVSHREFGCTYSDYIRATSILTRDRSNTLQALRRMVFNIIMHNRDDHVKNFSYIMEPDGTWQLSPAYDLMFSYGPNGEHSMMIGREGRNPGLSDILQVAEQGEIVGAEVQAVVEEVREAAMQWPLIARKLKVEAMNVNKIQEAIKENLERM